MHIMTADGWKPLHCNAIAPPPGNSTSVWERWLLMARGEKVDDRQFPATPKPLWA